ncbi:MAG: M20/M25/M40 family metallo-hydrolase [Woeseiaceae bacterium]
MTRALCVLGTLLFTLSCNGTEEPVDLEMIEKIRDEGFNRSQVMESVRVLSDEIGSRLTASPGMRAASKWSVEQLKDWGIEKAYLEPFEFGRGWSMTRGEVHMTSPRQAQLHALPIEWFPGTDGVIEGEIIYAPVSDVEDFARWRGKLAGKMVLIDEVSEPAPRETKIYAPYTIEELDELAEIGDPVDIANAEESWLESVTFERQTTLFAQQEGALAIIRGNSSGNMALNNQSNEYHAGRTPTIPSVAIAREHYERLIRLAEHGNEVRLSLDVEVEFYDDDHNGYNTIAEIPGDGSSSQIVMAGAHIDTRSPGDGAADNAAGVAVVMEALRILKALEVEPPRTIRLGLWSGEEQEYFGSARHVRSHFGHYPRISGEPHDLFGDYEAADLSKPIVKADGYEDLSVYFNYDNGAGKVRGIYTEGNEAVVPIFEAWLAPFHDLDATHVSLNHTTYTDHESFELIGLPGFQFIQDRTIGNGGAHTQLDMFDETYEEDLKQASVIMASFLYHAAMREERMPRLSEPTPINDNSKDE